MLRTLQLLFVGISLGNGSLLGLNNHHVESLQVSVIVTVEVIVGLAILSAKLSDILIKLASLISPIDPNLLFARIVEGLGLISEGNPLDR
jgi:hypothetical protein